MLKKAWHDPVLSKVIAAGVCATITWIVNYLFHLWSWSVQFEKLKRAVGGVWTFLLTTSPIPHWLIGLGGIIALLAVVILIGAVTSAAESAKQSQSLPGSDFNTQPSWNSYTTDIFFGIRWRWSFQPSGEPTNPVCFCPRCGCQLRVAILTRFRGLPEIAFRCASCDCYVERINKSLSDVETEVSLLIQKNLRDRSWADRARNNLANPSTNATH